MPERNFNRRVPPKRCSMHQNPVASRYSRHLLAAFRQQSWRIGNSHWLESNDGPGLVKQVWLVFDSAANALICVSAPAFLEFLAMLQRDDLPLVHLTIAWIDDDNGPTPLFNFCIDRDSGMLATPLVTDEDLTRFQQHLYQVVSKTLLGEDTDSQGFSLFSLFCNDPDIQHRVLCDFLDHVASLPAVEHTADELAAMVSEDIAKSRDHHWQTGSIITRMQALQCLTRRGVLDDQLRKQTSIRPVMTTLPIPKIIDMVVACRLISREELESRSRKSSTVHLRYCTAAICRASTSRSLGEIAWAVGKRDHSTIVYGLQLMLIRNSVCKFHARLMACFTQCADHLAVYGHDKYRELIEKLKG